MIIPTDAVQRIRAAFPQLVIEKTALLAGGQYNAVVRVNDDLIFRIPRFAEGAEKLEREAAIFDGIRPYLSLSIPEALYRHFAAPDEGSSFAGYRLLQGEPLSHEAVADLDAVAQASIAAQLAAFLRELRAIPYHEALGDTPASAGDTQMASWRASWSELAARLHSAVFPHIPSAAQEYLATLFSRFLGEDANFAFVPTLIHGDFGTGNILFQQATATITGIIDFDSARLGDPAYDLATLLTYDEQFTRHVVRSYDPTSAELSRAHFYRATFAAQEALYGAEHDDPDAFARGIAPYLIAQNPDRHA